MTNDRLMSIRILFTLIVKDYEFHISSKIMRQMATSMIWIW